MPTYEYRCEKCGYEFDEFQSITAPPLKKCPHCGHRSLQRLIGSGGGIIFKGSGFYQTDYRSDAYKKAAEADKSTTSPTKDKDSKSTKDSKDSTKKKSTGTKSTTAA